MSASTGTSTRTDSPSRHPGMTGTWMSRWGNLAYDLLEPAAAPRALPSPATTLPVPHRELAGFAA